jgi:hypothetical protein
VSVCQVAFGRAWWVKEGTCHLAIHDSMAFVLD